MIIVLLREKRCHRSSNPKVGHLQTQASSLEKYYELKNKKSIIK
jgi:hypothetical protein